jgi:hypothetical protein
MMSDEARLELDLCKASLIFKRKRYSFALKGVCLVLCVLTGDIVDQLICPRFFEIVKP